ncbi:MAG: hypothetical protein BWY61_00540 [Firmicutes bacterium ADurb.Bin354]|nr:MAG: hypothetical protein BWY61_00540 [Firmicutes bacterium ADurb.Bin354]
MSKKDEVFVPALKGKKIPIISLDNKWYRLMAGIEHTPEMIEKENKLKGLLKQQGRINSELKSIRKEKAALMDKIVGVMDEDDSASKQADYSDRINECNSRIDNLQDDLMELPKQINEVNLALMLDTMEICDRVIAENTEKINEFNDWIDNVRIELKKNVVRRQECEMKNQQMYFYMHDIFGPDVMDIFDMQYNPEDRMIKASEAVPEKK